MRSRPGSTAQAPAASVVNDCLRLSAAKIDWGDRDVADKHRKLWLETCKQAYAQNGDDPHIKVALAGAMTDRNEFIPLLRSAIAQNDTEAMLLLFNDYNSFDRHLDRPDLIPRAEAEQALRRAAQLGNPDAMFRLATILTRGGPIKHDMAGARYWGERLLVSKPPKDMTRANLQVLVGKWLSESTMPTSANSESNCSSRSPRQVAAMRRLILPSPSGARIRCARASFLKAPPEPIRGMRWPRWPTC